MMDPSDVPAFRMAENNAKVRLCVYIVGFLGLLECVCVCVRVCACVCVRMLLAPNELMHLFVSHSHPISTSVCEFILGSCIQP